MQTKFMAILVVSPKVARKDEKKMEHVVTAKPFYGFRSSSSSSNRTEE